MHRFTALLLFLAVAVPGARAWAQTPAAPVAAAPQSLSLQPGDVVQVTIWREEDLSGEFLVDELGVVTLPLIGEQQVVGISMRDLRARLIEQYRVHLRNPSITVTPLRRVNVTGEVQKPSLYTVDPTVSLAGAIALAGGPTPNGDIRRVRIVRGDQVIRERVSAGESLVDAEIRSGDQIIVERRNWFERNSTFVVSTILSATSIVIALVR